MSLGSVSRSADEFGNVTYVARQNDAEGRLVQIQVGYNQNNGRFTSLGLGVDKNCNGVIERNEWQVTNNPGVIAGLFGRDSGDDVLRAAVMDSDFSTADIHAVYRYFGGKVTTSGCSR